MLVGHFAVGFVAKCIEPKISLGTLVLAAMVADLLGCIFMIAGIEHVRIKPGMGAANYFVVSDIAMSHSLLMDAIWAALFAAAYFLRRHYPRGAWVLFVAVLSHWLLDFVSHRPDMPLAPGVPGYFGLGLWTSIRATVIVEGGSTLAPFVMSSGRENSRGEWLMPPMLGIKIMPIGPSRAIACASCPAPLGIGFVLSPSCFAESAMN